MNSCQDLGSLVASWDNGVMLKGWALAQQNVADSLAVALQAHWIEESLYLFSGQK